MTFLALRFDASAADAMRWSDALLDAGALSVDVTDPHAGTAMETARYGEPGESIALWPESRLTALFGADADVLALVRGVSKALDLAVPAHRVEGIGDQDWVRRSQAQFQPIRLAARLWIVPSWCEPVDAQAINIRLDPGSAFGTGSHPTTRLCVEWMVAHLRRGDSVLDYGCGSGILAIAAAKLGAASVAGIDIDPQAIAASRSNATQNGVDARFGLPESLPAGRFDVVVANILANPLQLLAPLFAARVRAGGSLMLSGVLESQGPAVIAAYARWFTIASLGTDEGWVALAGSRNDDDA